MKIKTSPVCNRGFTLIELMIALAISAVVTTVYQRYQIIETTEEAIAQGVASHLLVVQGGVTKYLETKFVELSTGLPVAGFADPLAPTVSELKAASYLPATVRDVTATNQAILVSTVRTGCPGMGCNINALVYPSGPIVLGRTGNTPRLDLAAIVVQSLKGAGGMSFADNSTTIRGPGMSFPNPMGATVGVVGVSTNQNTAFWNQFVRMMDTRDPNLQGNLSVAGNANLGGNAAVAGTLGVTGAVTASSTVKATGKVSSGASLAATDALNCDRASLSSTGSVVVRNAACVQVGVIDSLGRLSLSDATGLARIIADPIAGSLSMRNAAGSVVTSMSTVGNAGSLDVRDAAGTPTASLNGGTGVVGAKRAVVTDAGTEGAPCGAGVANGEFVQDTNASGTILMCRAGVWVKPGLQNATLATACAPSGRLAQDNSSATLICRGGFWASLNDRIGRQVQIARSIVTDGVILAKPSCGASGSAGLQLTPIDVVMDYAGVPPRNRYTANYYDNGGSWTVTLRLSDSVPAQYTTSFAGTPYALSAWATTFCDYPS